VTRSRCECWPRPWWAPGPRPTRTTTRSCCGRGSSGASLALAGDAQNEEQQDLLTLDPAQLRCDVLKVAHHGSAYQETGSLDGVAPRIALVSVGAGNPSVTRTPGFWPGSARPKGTVLRADQDGDLAVARTPAGLAVATHNAA
jgi:competence protein ComEC